MKISRVLMAILLMSLTTIVLPQIIAQEEPAGIVNASLGAPSNESELASFVESAVVHIQEVGEEQAIKDFMDLNSSWVRGDVYIVAADFNGTSLCLPYMPDKVGTDRLNVTNDQGVYINRELRSIAQNGSGFYEYSWRNPISNQSEPKISYVTKVDDTWWLGAGIYETSRDINIKRYVLANLTRLAEEYPIDPKVGFSIKQAILGKNASINLAQVEAGTHVRAHYHSMSDSIEFIIQGQANMTIEGKTQLVKSGDVIYIPAGTVHALDVLGTDNYLAFAVYAPPLNETDRIFV
jgi:quercetin dioxygenase-like cupin family protein